MVASYGAKDPVLKGGAKKVRLSLQAAGVTSDVKEYPNAGHGFINRTAALSPLNLIMRVSGIGHDHESAADAKKRILEFFDLHLRAAESLTPANAESSA
jgi:carboxymethylenebutenolidase